MFKINNGFQVPIDDYYNRLMRELIQEELSCQDKFSILHAELEEHIQHIGLLVDQYTFRGADYFDPEEVLKVPQVHLE